jgi:hypothetical protein
LETWCQRREGAKSHVIATVTDLSRIVVLRRSHDLGSRLPREITNRTIRVAVVFLVLGASPVLDIVAFTLLALHDLVDATWGIVLMVVVEVTSELPLLALAMKLVDVAMGVTATSVLFEVGT